jgi:hypothetical protein
VVIVFYNAHQSSIGSQPENNILGVQSCFNHDRTGIHPMLLESLPSETVRLSADRILARISHGKRKHSITSGKQFLLRRLELIRIAEPDFRVRDRMPIDCIHNFSGDSKSRRSSLRPKITREKKDEGHSSKAMSGEPPSAG